MITRHHVTNSKMHFPNYEIYLYQYFTVPWNSITSSGVPWYSVDLFGLKGGSMKFHGTLKVPWSLTQTPNSIAASRAKFPLNSMEIRTFNGICLNHQISWNTLESLYPIEKIHGITWNWTWSDTNFHGIFHGNFVSPNKISSSSNEFLGTLGIPVSSTWGCIGLSWNI